MKKKNKLMALMMALVLLVGAAVGGTFAWLVDKTDDVKNTFTAGDINIKLSETTGDEYTMIPGKQITKNPQVTVEAKSEDCWLFVKITEANDVDTFLTYSLASGWTALSGVDGVYYREVSLSTSDQSFYVLVDNKVTVKTSVTKAQLEALTTDTYPTLTFKAYAIQKEGFSTASAAWEEASK